jgi:hypothetical protein
MRPEILYYNTHIVPEIIQSKKHLMAPFLSEEYSDNLLDTYNKFGLNKHNMVYDRTKSIPHYLNIAKDIHPIPLGFSTKSFNAVAEERAKQLLATGKTIYVLWSGGIDSTYILLLLRHYANDPEQVRIYGTYNSIIESGDMFDRRLKHEFKYIIQTATDNELAYQETDCIYVSGMCGNQLFGPTDDFFATGETAMFHHTLGTPKTIYESYEKHIDSNLLEFFDPMIKASPKKLETVNDLRWYCIFNLDWYTALYEHRTMIQGGEKAERIIGFFNTDDFQRWAINTNEPFTKIKGNPNTHRWQMRETLAELGEHEYSLNKPKKISNFNVNRPQWIFLLKGFHNILDD